MIFNICFGCLLGLVLTVSALFGSLTEEEYRQVERFLLPQEHPVKAKLDAIFSKSRVVADEGSLKRAGFKWYKRHSHDHVYVARHSRLKGVLLKLLLDCNIGKNDFDMCLRRVQGADIIRKSIARHRYGKFFKVPKKWIYILPDHPSPPPGYEKRKVIVVVEKMDILHQYDNESCWKSRQYVSKNFLIALHTLLSALGLLDSVHTDNIPFCSDGRVAFIDTEHFYIWPVHERKLTQKLPRRYREFWETLITKPYDF